VKVAQLIHLTVVIAVLQSLNTPADAMTRSVIGSFLSSQHQTKPLMRHWITQDLGDCPDGRK
jgi:hypothetical protein